MSSSVTPAQPSDTGNRAIRKSSSPKRIEANRRNALRSTGPRTAKGKRIASHNAIKHGLLAREVVIKGGDGEEDLQEFHELLERLWEDYCPVGVVEEMLVQKIASCWWRLARVLRAENGEVCKRADSAAVEHHLRRSNELNFNLISLELLRSGALYSPNNKADQKLSLRDRLLAAQKSQSDLKRNHLGIEYLSALLQEAKRNIDSEGYISKKVQDVLL